MKKIDLALIQEAIENIKGVVHTTPLVFMKNLSEKYQAKVYFKREDLQTVRSYKIRGAYNKIKKLKANGLRSSIVCASAGNHAQGVAFACNNLQVFGIIHMPVTTPMQKIKQVEMFGSKFVEIKLIGDTFDESYHHATVYCNENNNIFIHPFNDIDVMAGQGTVGFEILNQMPEALDILFLPIGGGGLASGVGSVLKTLSPRTKIIGLEPTGAASFQNSLKQGENTELKTIDKFVDGAAVKKMGDLSFDYCKSLIDSVQNIDEGHICSVILSLYNENAIVVEPAGALSIAALDTNKNLIKGKCVVCIISGGNNDITRMEEIKERALFYENLKHYFLVKFPQRAGALKEFVVDVMGENDDITYFQYTKKNNRSTSTAVVGIELKDRKDLSVLMENMKGKGFFEEYLNDKPDLLNFLV